MNILMSKRFLFTGLLMLLFAVSSFGAEESVAHRGFGPAGVGAARTAGGQRGGPVRPLAGGTGVRANRRQAGPLRTGAPG